MFRLHTAYWIYRLADVTMLTAWRHARQLMDGRQGPDDAIKPRDLVELDQVFWRNGYDM